MVVGSDLKRPGWRSAGPEGRRHLRRLTNRRILIDCLVYEGSRATSERQPEFCDLRLSYASREQRHLTSGNTLA